MVNNTIAIVLCAALGLLEVILNFKVRTSQELLFYILPPAARQDYKKTGSKDKKCFDEQRLKVFLVLVLVVA
jgi:hypothetical protein